MHRPSLLARRLAVVRLVSLAGLAWSAPAARAGDVTVAVAANFAGTLAQLAPGFTAATGHTLTTTAGATGKFYSQILAGAPFQVLLAADATTPQKLIAQGHAVAGSQFTYATGQLVLWSTQPGLVDDQGAVLASGRFRKLAIANPKLAPYGQAAMDVLRARGLLDALAPKLVTGESIAQAYQFVLTGNAELGFVALSQVLAPMRAQLPPAQMPTPVPAQVPAPGQPVPGSFWRVPAALHAPIRQDAVLLKAGAHSAAAAALLAYLKSAPARALMQAHGYGP